MAKFMIDCMLFRDTEDPYSVVAGIVGWGTIILITTIIVVISSTW